MPENQLKKKQTNPNCLYIYKAKTELTINNLKRLMRQKNPKKKNNNNKTKHIYSVTMQISWYI